MGAIFTSALPAVSTRPPERAALARRQTDPAAGEAIRPAALHGGESRPPRAPRGIAQSDLADHLRQRGRAARVPARSARRARGRPRGAPLHRDHRAARLPVSARRRASCKRRRIRRERKRTPGVGDRWPRRQKRGTRAPAERVCRGVARCAADCFSERRGRHRQNRNRRGLSERGGGGRRSLDWTRAMRRASRRERAVSADARRAEPAGASGGRRASDRDSAQARADVAGADAGS